MKNEVAVLYTTWPDAESAAAAGRVLVAEGLCACANILAPMRSIYRWSAAVEETVEVPALFKTTAEAASALKTRILTLHPYENACVLMLPVAQEGSSDAFTDWIWQGVTAIHEWNLSSFAIHPQLNPSAKPHGAMSTGNREFSAVCRRSSPSPNGSRRPA